MAPYIIITFKRGVLSNPANAWLRRRAAADGRAWALDWYGEEWFDGEVIELMLWYVRYLRSSPSTLSHIQHFTDSTNAHVSPKKWRKYKALCRKCDRRGIRHPPRPPRHWTFRIFREFRGDRGLHHVPEHYARWYVHLIVAVFKYLHDEQGSK